MNRRRMLFHAVVLPALFWPVCLPAQNAAPAKPNRLEMGITYQEAYAERTFGNAGFFLQGGAIEINAPLLRDFRVTAEVEGLHAGPDAQGRAPLSEVLTTFGLRYRHDLAGHVSGFTEFRLGEADVFGTVLPGGSGPVAIPANGQQTTASSLALIAGGGLDVRLSPRTSVRLIQADWLRTQLPNGQTNIQNQLQLGAGVLFRFPRR